MKKIEEFLYENIERIIVVNLSLSCIFLFSCIYNSYENYDDAKDYNTGYCECGGEWEFVNSFATQYTIYRCYQCNKCEEIIEVKK